MIKVENLTKTFKVRKRYEGLGGTLKTLFSNEYEKKIAVDDMSFEINKGEIVGYIGLNGAGKSTTIKILTGLMSPTSGSCVVDGMIPYKDRKNYVKKIGSVFGQRTQLWWDLPVSESFSILKKIYEIPDDIYRKNLEYLIKTLDVKEFYLTPVRNLSLGQKMRADLVASLLHQPKVIFLDEPTIGLDIIVKDKLRKAIKQINNDLDTTVILTTHDMDDIQETCEKIIMVDKGKKIFDGSMEQLKSRYSACKEVEFTLGHINKSNNDFDILKNKCQAVKSVIKENQNIIVKYSNQEITDSEIIQLITKHYLVRDITIQDEKFEDILMNIYG